MKQQRTDFVCNECGTVQPKWSGKCPDCGSWNTMEERMPVSGRGPRATGDAARPVTLPDLKADPGRRRITGLSELDHVLGGGLVEGQVVLIGGEPGIGKSTLLLQVLAGLATAGNPSLYVCAEESPAQVKIRAERLGLASAPLLLLAETDMDAVIAAAAAAKPAVFVIDSIQMMHAAEVPAAPGSVTQVRECAMAASAFAKKTGAVAFIVGHVTKDGSIAGPRVLEHLVDTVLYFEGDRFHSYRLLRAVKNRFGPTMDLGIFEMLGEGLRGVQNPSGLFLAGSCRGAPGGAVVPCMEGRRPLLVEVQALVSPSPYGTAVRRTTGLDSNRVPMILAVMEKRAGLSLGGSDVFVNVVGGVKVIEPAADLGVVLAVASSFLNLPVPEDLVAAGEIGLRGEVRPVPQAEARLAEAGKLGFKRALFPPGSAQVRRVDMEVIEVSNVSAVLDVLR